MKKFSPLQALWLLLLTTFYGTTASAQIPTKQMFNLNAKSLSIKNINKDEIKLKATSKGIKDLRIARQETTEVGSAANTINVDISHGMLILEGDFVFNSKQEDFFAGFFCQAKNTRGDLILFNNMTDFQILKSKHLQNYKLVLPFDQQITEIKWGIYIKGMGQLEARNISLKVDEGEFSNKWEVENIQNWSNKTSKLFVDYAKIWGFLKYFHPKNSLGKINWDSVLVTHIDNLISSKTQSTLDLKIEEMLAITGGIAACDSCSYKIADSLKLNYSPPLEDLNISSKNLKHLRYILENFRKVNSYYVQTSPRGTPNPSFVNEAAFNQLPVFNSSLTELHLWQVGRMTDANTASLWARDTAGHLAMDATATLA
ncbi:MAG: hypothetical protein EOO96_28335 [Pedobacter sp.]|nr:MAG: hypothetical protein EOO96_28335 [Pedobacter sp.]